MKEARDFILIEENINVPIERCWAYYTDPIHIINWNFASEDWHTPWAKSDLREGGTFVSRMESKDGKMGFDYIGIYKKISPNSILQYELGDGRAVNIEFHSFDNATNVKIDFEAEQINPKEMQRLGWLSILHKFKKYAESQQQNKAI